MWRQGAIHSSVSVEKKKKREFFVGLEASWDGTRKRLPCRIEDSQLDFTCLTWATQVGFNCRRGQSASSRCFFYGGEKQARNPHPLAK